MTYRLLIPIIFGVLATFNIRSAQAQHYRHFTMWSRGQVVMPLSQKWDMAATFHWRRQNNYHQNRHNPLLSPLLTGGQFLFTYRNTKNTVWIHAAQLTYFYANQLLGKDEDFEAPPNRELRYAGGIELNQQITTKWSFRERIMQELRFFESNDFRPLGRIRIRSNVRYEWTSFVSLNGITEILFHAPPQLTGKPFRFQQYWLGGSLMWQLNKKITFETGYTHILTQRATLVEFDNQHILNLNLVVRL